MAAIQPSSSFNSASLLSIASDGAIYNDSSPAHIDSVLWNLSSPAEREALLDGPSRLAGDDDEIVVVGEEPEVDEPIDVGGGGGGGGGGVGGVGGGGGSGGSGRR